jgi:hypothetical protein
MKTTTQIILTGLMSALTLTTTTFAAGANGAPTIVDPNPPKVEGAGNDGSVTTAAASKIEVSCQDLQSVVKKGERQAVMMKWNTGFFGKEFTPAKRCQIVSDRLQQAADANGGTFKGLQLSSGTVNGQAAICVLQDGQNGCNGQNLLFTLKPENAKNPNAAIERIMTFAQDGSTAVEESASLSPKVDRDLGNWEKKAFPALRKNTSKVSPKSAPKNNPASRPTKKYPGGF